MKRADSGFSLVEVLVASVLAAVVAAGTMASFVTSARITRWHNATTMSEAGGHSLELLEQFRNVVGADATGDFFKDNAGAGWLPIPIGTIKGTTSALSVTHQAATREYKVTAIDCDGVGGTGDCYALSVKTDWE
jgi:prepilin-type N-terminal cleavage/methylation domain-containing protein